MVVGRKAVGEEEGDPELKVKVLKEEGNELRLLVEKSTPEMMNSLRRVILSEIPVMAVHKVIFSKNTSALYDEMIAHRIGLLCLKADKQYVPVSECSCKGKGCSKCQATVELVKKGPCKVYAKDLKCKGVSVVHPDSLLLILQEGQEINLNYSFQRKCLWLKMLI